MKIKIGTRGSKLALWQAYYVEDKLKAKGVETEIVIIETKGDKILDRSLSKIGSKGVFTEELEDQLRSGEIDIAVHSAKDLQSELAADLEIIAFTERELVNDVLVSFNKNLSLQSGEPFVVGTSSTRRVAMLKYYYPHIQVVDMRGNLQTRLRKLEEKQCDALLLAYAGVHRMHYDDLIAEHLPLTEFVPPVGQGCVAIEASKTLAEEKRLMIGMLINDAQTQKCLLAERAYLKKLQGGCSIPSFGKASLEPNEQGGLHLKMTAGLISLDGKRLIKVVEESTVDDPEALGIKVAERVLADGGHEILREIKEKI
ncbi:hydroxymethylbilane synthase [Emticicia sp. 21SJ11W-3]|uniref:hydroxymethylbilane synthase n=1 Tax=Emticicia sp. 21SJ11W-3 TaxID=2916755 RepID=UPI0020A0A25C|nr:hydroxymethylbilane synthase [Emticicia sp. 21SJ11W-3]UTA68074.1 hydroxymethylbilane synthase [Emticicia sp. 21SJ11W-3]